MLVKFGDYWVRAQDVRGLRLEEDEDGWWVWVYCFSTRGAVEGSGVRAASRDDAQSLADGFANEVNAALDANRGSRRYSINMVSGGS